nr:uncharacterized protein CTRU02_08279 [Colletotrichum truncatum]KAF6790150.1 hypothetical protein CTRU02_08279 [Colletotrichum truncatum]
MSVVSSRDMEPEAHNVIDKICEYPLQEPDPDQAADPLRTLSETFNLGAFRIHSITSHRIIKTDDQYNVNLYVVTEDGNPYQNGWKTELELSWIALGKVVEYWELNGGRDTALRRINPCLPFFCRKVLAALGHRKQRYCRLELFVVFQGVNPDPLWMDEISLRLDRNLDPRTLNDYWKAANIVEPPKTDDLQAVAEELLVQPKMIPKWSITIGSL